MVYLALLIATTIRPYSRLKIKNKPIKKSHQIGTELISCARAALALGDLDLLGRFLSGFYKATNDEASAVAYFTKTELIELVLSALTLSNKACAGFKFDLFRVQMRSFISNLKFYMKIRPSQKKPIRAICHQLLIEYLVFIEGPKKVKQQVHCSG